MLAYLNHFTKHRKERLSPPKKTLNRKSMRAFFFAPFPASLTVEAAVAVPLFLFFMISALQYGNAMETAVKFGAALCDTGKTMAIAAYAQKYGGELGEVPEIAVTALSAVYAQNKVTAQAGSTAAVKSINMLQSSFLQKDQTVDLVLSYQIRSPVGLVRLPGNFFLQRARIRAWTGRTIPGDSAGEEDGSGQEGMVYVTATGSVYHEDADCTHLKLSIRTVDASQLQTLRNAGGGIYHACERCNATPDKAVYITREGNRYHSTLGCSGLKRTVRQVSREEAASMRACSKCGGSTGD